MDELAQKLWIERILKMLNAAFPDEVSEDWQRCERLLSQVQVGHELIKQTGLCFGAAAHLLNQVGQYLEKRYGFFMEAEELYQQAYKIYKSILGLVHLETLVVYSNLARVYLVQGKYEMAE